MTMQTQINAMLTEMPDITGKCDSQLRNGLLGKAIVWYDADKKEAHLRLSPYTVDFSGKPEQYDSEGLSFLKKWYAEAVTDQDKIKVLTSALHDVGNIVESFGHVCSVFRSAEFPGELPKLERKKKQLEFALSYCETNPDENSVADMIKYGSRSAKIYSRVKNNSRMVEQSRVGFKRIEQKVEKMRELVIPQQNIIGGFNYFTFNNKFYSGGISTAFGKVPALDNILDLSLNGTGFGLADVK